MQTKYLFFLLLLCCVFTTVFLVSATVSSDNTVPSFAVVCAAVCLILPLILVGTPEEKPEKTVKK
jgi:hypothetical protein